MAADLAHYTITGAQDWPMFKEMLSGMRILFVLLWGTVGSLVCFMWRDLRGRIATQRGEDRTNCTNCQASRNAEFGYVWGAIDVVAPRNPVAQAAVVAAKVRHRAEGSG